MQLTHYQYKEFHGRPNVWGVSGISLGEVNLVVGKNTSGKSHTLSSLVYLSLLVSNRLRSMQSVEWNCTFKDGHDHYEYRVSFTLFKLTDERLTRNGEVLITRDAEGIGQIWSVPEQRLIELQTPPGELAIVNRRVKQHDFCQKLHDWGMSVFSYRFGTDMGGASLAVQVSMPVEVDHYNQNMVIGIFRKGQLEFGQPFVEAIRKDMSRIGYNISDISVSQPSTVPLFHPQLVGIAVTEIELGFPTEQPVMSQGMFRALSVIIQVTYVQMSSIAGCILVDDVGEGLDFERSCELIELLKEKSKASNVQLILSTNDRFVMNSVPLTSWTLLKRQGGDVRAFNYENSKKYFDEFRFTGLNNFDFFAMDFLEEDIEEPQREVNEEHEEAGNLR